MPEIYEPSDVIHNWAARGNTRFYYSGASTRLCDLNGFPCWEVRVTEAGYEVHYNLHEEDHIWLATFAHLGDVEKFLAVEICDRVRARLELPMLRIPLERNQSDASFDIRRGRTRSQVMYRRGERAAFPRNDSHDFAQQFTHYAELPLNELLDDLLSEESMFAAEIDNTEPAAV